MESGENVSNSCNFLSKPLNLNDLVDGGTQFDIKSDFDDGSGNDIFEELDFGANDNDENDVGIEQKQKNLTSPWTKSFDELRTQMKKINKYMYKVITRAGNEEKEQVPEGARVALRYSAFWEGEGTPFDSSFLRGTTYTFITGKGEVLEGLEAAVRTMHEAESAMFVISYHLLFLELGCPPRIKPRADGLFKIEVLKYNLVGNLEAIDQVPPEERNKFANVFDKIKEMHLSGVDFFKQRSYVNATRAFERAVDALNFCVIKDEAEHAQQSEFLIKLYTNLAICYLKINAPAKTCVIVQEIKRITKNKPPCKALFQEGRALLILGEYKKARQALNSARQLEPSSEAIISELTKLEDRFSRYKKTEREIWSKAFGVANKPVKTVNNDANAAVKEEDNSCDWRAAIVEMLGELQKNTSIDEIPLPMGLGRDGIDLVNELAHRFDMSLKLSPLDENSYTLVKTKKK